MKHEFHGMRNHPMYDRWASIKQRCRNEDNEYFDRYGGRGIAMHQSWIDSFQKFYEDVVAEIGPCPEGKSLDRKDNNGSYMPSNIRWADATEQLCNQRRRKDSNTGVKGVSVSGGYVSAFLSVRRRRISKRFGKDSPENRAAAEAWLRSKREELHGEFANHGD
ncbi:hypothetical protein [Burkholderia pseudomallei]|uniref:hypothetical protein n=1 Tax=Burkholderia pseudomallei TaxID=28450 RepID=UPI001178C0DF|nr:hypothetical protein [Burkholderia pseudomallei]